MSTTAVLFSPTMLDNRHSSNSNTSPNVNNNSSSTNGVLCRMQEISRRMYIAASAYTETVRSTWDENSSRHRNLSGPSCTGPRPTLDNGRTLTTPPPGCTGSRGGRDGAAKERHASSGGGVKDSNHRKLDRSASEDVINGNHHHNNSNERGGRGVNSSRYKTELCRPFEENGHCKYGDKCQFAHGMHELRNLARHPKYKTERCRTFHTIGFCPYGPRCHFIHNEEERAPSSSKRRQQQQQMGALPSALPCDGPAALRDTKAICASPTVVSSPSLGRSRGQSGGSQSLGSSFESVATAPSTPGTMSPVLSVDDKFPSITTFSASDLTPPDSCGSLTSPQCRAGAASDTVFNFPASDASSSASLLTPLNVQTQQFNFVNNLLDLQMLYQQRGNYAAVAANLNVGVGLGSEAPSSCGVSGGLWFADNKLQEELDILELNHNYQPSSDLFPASCSSPELLSDSMGSSSSLDEPSNVVSNPMDIGRNMRLPIFSRLT